MDHCHEFLVHLEPKAPYSFFELQDIIWPCEHIMAWDDREGRDYTKHFHPCWRWVIMQKLYKLKIPYFLANDLVAIYECFLLEAIVKEGPPPCSLDEK